jgi:exopolysaccharide production protein ExoQ
MTKTHATPSLRKGAERYCLVFMLTIFVAQPFLAGGQALGAEALNPLEALAEVSKQGDPVKQAILMGVYAVCTVLLVMTVRNRPRMLLFLGAPLLMLTAWCFASVGWSIDPGVSLRRCAALLGTVIMMTYAGLRFDLEDMLAIMSRVTGIVLIGSLVLAVVSPSLGLDYEGRLRGVFAHKNAMGSYAALALLMLAARLSETKYPSKLAAISDGSLVVLSIACMALAQSATVVPVLVVGLPLLLIARLVRSAAPGVLALMPAAAAIAVILAAWVAAYNTAAIAEILGKDDDISGRTLVWQFAVDMIFKRPWLGYGFESFWEGFNSPGAVFWTISGLGVPHAHNGYLQLALGVGGIGLALCLVAVIAVAVKLAWLLRCSREPFIPWAIAFLAFYLMYNISDTWLWGGNDLRVAFFIYVVLRTNISVRQAVIGSALAPRTTQWTPGKSGETSAAEGAVPGSTGPLLAIGEKT